MKSDRLAPERKRRRLFSKSPFSQQLTKSAQRLCLWVSLMASFCIHPPLGSRFTEVTAQGNATLLVLMFWASSNRRGQLQVPLMTVSCYTRCKLHSQMLRRKGSCHLPSLTLTFLSSEGFSFDSIRSTDGLKFDETRNRTIA